LAEALLAPIVSPGTTPPQEGQERARTSRRKPARRTQAITAGQSAGRDRAGLAVVGRAGGLAGQAGPATAVLALVGPDCEPSRGLLELAPGETSQRLPLKGELFGCSLHIDLLSRGPKGAGTFETYLEGCSMARRARPGPLSLTASTSASRSPAPRPRCRTRSRHGPGR